jgi:hypothetical protein
VRRAADYSRSINAAFTALARRKIFGCGESFTSLDKRGTEGGAVDGRRQRHSKPGHVQADPVFHEQPRLRHVHAHFLAHHLRFGNAFPASIR